MHPPIALLPIRTMFFDLFSPQVPHFSIEHPKFPILFPIFPIFPKSAHFGDKCSETFRKRVFLRHCCDAKRCTAL